MPYASEFYNPAPAGHDNLGYALTRTAVSIICDQIKKFQKNVDIVRAVNLGWLGSSRVHRRGKQIYFTHEKKIHVKIRLL